MIVSIPHLGRDIPFSLESDGWYVNKTHNLAIAPDATVCITHPWYVDHISDPPQHKFTVVNKKATSINKSTISG